MNIVKFSTIIILIILNGTSLKAQQDSSRIVQEVPTNEVSSLKITTLSTMLVNFNGIGEWGYSALVEVDEKKILFDTGKNPETVLQNAKDLGIDLADVEDVFLSHFHQDHTGGLLTLRKELKKINPNALIRVHVGKGIFNERLGHENSMPQIKDELEADGVQFIVYENEYELFPGVWITGPIRRIHDEKNYFTRVKIKMGDEFIEDYLPEDQSLAIDTPDGFVLVSGCGHAGIVNTLEHIKSNINDKSIFTVIGGFHLMDATDEHLKWTADKLGDFGVSKIIGAHCTGINALYTLRHLMNLSRSDAVVGSIGDSFDLENGINAGYIAR
jgi:7,8-dihydropterin-6-yl-methyl-4-(beta-D-ribofuranosyl)aminobenzene 5'-phosphate synthase